MYRAVLPVSWDQERNGYHTRWRSGWGSADLPDRGVHGEINSNSSNDDDERDSRNSRDRARVKFEAEHL